MHGIPQYATQRNATQRNATQRNATQLTRLSFSSRFQVSSFSSVFQVYLRKLFPLFFIAHLVSPLVLRSPYYNILK